MAGDAPHRNAQTQAARIDLPLFAALSALPALYVFAYLPAHLQMPGIAALGVCVAAIAAALGWALHCDRRAAGLTIWDFAGASLLVGITAGAMSNSHHVSQFFGVAGATP
jgi:hypothetical protein